MATPVTSRTKGIIRFRDLRACFYMPLAYDGILGTLSTPKPLRAYPWLRALWLGGLAATAWVSLLPGDRIGTLQGSDKLWHGGTYLLLALPLRLLYPTQFGAWMGLLFLASYGAAIEVGQTFVPRRSFEWGDMLANTAGALAGLLLGSFLARLLPQSANTVVPLPNVASGSKWRAPSAKPKTRP